MTDLSVLDLPAVAGFVSKGRRFGYPDCCVAEFCVDFIEMGMPALRRHLQGWDWDDESWRPGFVPCREHMEAETLEGTDGRWLRK